MTFLFLVLDNTPTYEDYILKIPLRGIIKGEDLFPFIGILRAMI